ncbi:MAG: hypothetical protein NC413_07540 [Muribaculum sp.]|nr:hypothetical protein [Muribaculum sp.]
MKKADTTYDVSFHYSRQSRESMNDKIIRPIDSERDSGTGLKNTTQK